MVRTDQAELDQWQAYFTELDADKSGKLDCDELTALLGKLGLAKMPEEAKSDEEKEEIKKQNDLLSKAMISAVDEDGDKTLDFEEFVALLRLKKTFESFDLDGSGQIDAKELKAMAESLGISATITGAKHLIKSVDTSGDGEIDWSEFCEIVSKSSGPTKGASGFSFAGVVQRAKNNGPPMFWLDPEDPEVKAKAVCQVKEKGRVLEHTGDDWGCHMLNMWMSSASYSAGSVILELEEMPEDAECYVGVVSKNYASNETDDKGKEVVKKWNLPIGTSKSQPGMAPWASVHNKTGEAYRKGVLVPMKVPKFGFKLDTGVTFKRVQIDLDMHKQEIQIDVLKFANSEWESGGAVLIENIPAEVAVAVCLKSEKRAAKVRVIGSSSEKAMKPGASDFQKTEEEQRGIKLDESTRTAMQLQM
mmetsp:Transcript_9211/g.18770  ORF Transcript_9211/g.18770 Transcript_9211/m.18770 type:complete len:418 (-) Transcript_9211:293-1546(-)